MKISSEQKKEYNLNGSILIKNVVKEKELEYFFNTFCKLFLKYNSIIQKLYPKYSSWIDSDLHCDLILLRKNNPKLFWGFTIV